MRRCGPRTRGAALALATLLAVAGSTLPGATRAGAVPSLRSQQWWIDSLGLPAVWRTTTGAGLTVAVLDSGVQAALPDLRGAVRPGFDVANPRSDGRSDTDPAGHGTSMAAFIAGRGRSGGIVGVAPSARILPVVLADPGATATVRALDRLTAMDRPPQIVNMSFAGASTCPPDVAAAVRRAVGGGMILVAAAGNQGALGNPPQAPADCPGVVAVAASDRAGSPWHAGSGGAYVALAAPGVGLVGYTPAGRTQPIDGSSASAAIVSGVLADLSAAYPRLSDRALVARLFATADTGHPGISAQRGRRNVAFGYGIVAAARALTARVPAGAPNPVYDAVGATGAKPTPTSVSSAPPARTASTAPASPTAPATTRAGPLPVAAPRHHTGSTAVLVAIVIACCVAGIAVGVALARRRRARPGG